MPEQALTTQNQKKKETKNMSIIDDLPVAPSMNDDAFKDFDSDLLQTSKSQSFKESPKSTSKEESIPVTSHNENIPVELMDTRGFETAVNAATRARTLAAIYTKYAERNELPPVEILQSDDLLSEAIQKTLVERAKAFYDTSRAILQTTLKDGDANELLESEDVTTIDALYEINESAK